MKIFLSILVCVISLVGFRSDVFAISEELEETLREECIDEMNPKDYVDIQDLEEQFAEISEEFKEHIEETKVLKAQARECLDLDEDDKNECLIDVNEMDQRIREVERDFVERRKVLGRAIKNFYHKLNICLQKKKQQIHRDNY